MSEKEEYQRQIKFQSQILNSVQQAIIVTDTDAKIIFWNDFAEKLYGYTKKEAIGKTTLELIAPEERISESEEKFEEIKNGNISVTEYLVKNKKGEVFPILMSISPIYNSENEVISIVGTSYDITNTVRHRSEIIETKLKAEENEKRFDLAMKASKDGIYDWNLVTNEIYYSPGWKNMLGYEDNELPNEFSVWEKLTKPEDVAKAMEMQQKLINKDIDRFEFEFRMKHKAGHWVYILSRGEAIFNEDGKAIRMIGTHVDISERKRSEKKTRKAFELLLIAEELAKMGSWSWKPKTDKVEWSDNMCRLYGIEPSEFNPDFDYAQKFTHPEDLEFVNKYVEKILAEKKELPPMVYRIVTPKNKVVWVKGSHHLLFNEQGEITEVFGAMQDVTSQKLAEIELTKAKEKAEESDRLKTEFINNMSHEIRTPMNGILGFTELVSKENLSSEKRKHFINIIQNSGKQLMRVIDDILEISKLGTKQVKVHEHIICLNNVLLEHFSVFDIKAKENKTPLYLKKGLSDIESTIVTDETKLNKILSNLLENALKFTHHGYIELGYTMKNEELNIYVKDSGIGISPEKLEIVFERFSQEEKDLSKNVGGLGLGLSIAKENAELLGGKITLDSKKGLGSTFVLTIPYKPAYSKDKKSTANNDLEKEKPYVNNILVAEDEEINYLFIETLLEDEINLNCRVIHAKHGKEAVDICKENHDIDIVLMDLKMPIMNGFDATVEIKKINPNVPIIAVSAYTSIQDKEKAFRAGCNDFISKPINIKTFSKTMHIYLK